MIITDYLISEKEANLLKQIARTGVFVNVFLKDLKISNKMVYKCLEKKLIEKGANKLIYGELLSTYYLSETGKEIIKKRYLINPYRSKPNQIEHDFLLGKIYLSLSDEEKETWITETELMLIHPTIVVTDGVYICNDNKKVGVEVITESYSKKDIEYKERFINKHCDKKLILKTKDFYC